MTTDRQHAFAALIFPTRVVAAVSGSVVYGLVAAQAIEPWSLYVAVGLGFLFGAFFVAGTGYRILLAVWQRQMRYAPPSWSGATAASALASAVGFIVLVSNGFAGTHLLLAFALAINVAYLWVKLGCVLAGCCGAPVTLLRREFDLRHLEISSAVVVLLMAVIAGMLRPGIGAGLGIAGHIIVRLFSRARRDRFSWGWPPLRQPGAELVPLYLVLALALSLSG